MVNKEFRRSISALFILPIFITSIVLFYKRNFSVGHQFAILAGLCAASYLIRILLCITIDSFFEFDGDNLKFHEKIFPPIIGLIMVGTVSFLIFAFNESVIHTNYYRLSSVSLVGITVILILCEIFISSLMLDSEYYSKMISLITSKPRTDSSFSSSTPTHIPGRRPEIIIQSLHGAEAFSGPRVLGRPVTLSGPRVLGRPVTLSGSMTSCDDVLRALNTSTHFDLYSNLLTLYQEDQYESPQTSQIGSLPHLPSYAQAQFLQQYSPPSYAQAQFLQQYFLQQNSHQQNSHQQDPPPSYAQAQVLQQDSHQQDSHQQDHPPSCLNSCEEGQFQRGFPSASYSEPVVTSQINNTINR